MQVREEASHLELQKNLEQQTAQHTQHTGLSHTASQIQPSTQSTLSAATMTVLTSEAVHALEVKLADAIAAADAAQEARGTSAEAAEGVKRENAHLCTCLATAQREAADARASAASAGMALDCSELNYSWQSASSLVNQRVVCSQHVPRIVCVWSRRTSSRRISFDTINGAGPSQALPCES